MNRNRVLILSVIILLGAYFRLDLLTANNFVIDSDEAIVGLMGKHVLEGAPIPTFYYGQHYMGSLEALTAALFFSVGGISSVALKLVPFMYSLLLIVATYALGRAVFTEREGYLSALFISIPASPLLVWSGMARGGFIEIVLIGTVLLTLFVEWAKERDGGSRKLCILGILAGIGWWVNNQILYTLVPVACLTPFVVIQKMRLGDSKLPHMLKELVVGVCGFFVGSSLFWIYNFSNDFASFGIFKRATLHEAFSHLAGVFETALPILIGAKRFWGSDEIFSGSTLFAYGIYSLFASLYVYRLASQQKGGSLLGAYGCILVLGAAIGIFSISSFGYLVEAPRYLLPLYPIVAVLAAGGVGVISWKALRITLSSALIFFNLTSTYLGGRAVPGEPFVAFGDRASKDHRELIEWLSKNRFSFVKTNYWIGYRLAFESEEKIRFIMIHDPHQIRIPSYEEAGMKLTDDQIPVVVTSHQATLWKLGLEARCIDYSEAILSGYHVLYNIRPRGVGGEELSSKDFEIAATHHSDGIAQAIDHNLHTRWGSGAPQRPDMVVTIRFKTPTVLKGLTVDLGDWKHDYARGLRIEGVTTDGKTIEEQSESKWDGEEYLRMGAGSSRVCLSPQPLKELRLIQTRTDPIFDWSIGELQLFK